LFFWGTSALTRRRYVARLADARPLRVWRDAPPLHIAGAGLALKPLLKTLNSRSTPHFSGITCNKERSGIFTNPNQHFII
jgi:hypothetical protein